MKTLSVYEQTKVLVSAVGYDFSADKRLLIPFTQGNKIGFVNRKMEIVANPQFAMYKGDCYSPEDFICVDTTDVHSLPTNRIARFQCWGLMNYKGEIVLPPKYCVLFPVKGNKGLYVAENKRWEYGMITVSGKEIVPFGTYDLIEEFDRGITRVKIGKRSSGIKNHENKWGLIDSCGNVVLPVEYDKIWKFQEKGYDHIVVEKDGKLERIPLSSILGGKASVRSADRSNCRPRYGEYAGSYAQDVMGYSDDVISDVFEGDPDAYWNID